MNLVVEIDKAELACRILEGLTGTRRPHGVTAEEALDAIQDGELHQDFLHAADAAMRYFEERINAGAVPS